MADLLTSPERVQEYILWWMTIESCTIDIVTNPSGFSSSFIAYTWFCEGMKLGLNSPPGLCVLFEIFQAANHPHDEWTAFLFYFQL